MRWCIDMLMFVEAELNLMHLVKLEHSLQWALHSALLSQQHVKLIWLTIALIWRIGHEVEDDSKLANHSAGPSLNPAWKGANPSSQGSSAHLTNCAEQSAYCAIVAHDQVGPSHVGRHLMVFCHRVGVYVSKRSKAARRRSRFLSLDDVKLTTVWRFLPAPLHHPRKTTQTVSADTNTKKCSSTSAGVVVVHFLMTKQALQIEKH